VTLRSWLGTASVKNVGSPNLAKSGGVHAPLPDEIMSSYIGETCGLKNVTFERHKAHDANGQRRQAARVEERERARLGNVVRARPHGRRHRAKKHASLYIGTKPKPGMTSIPPGRFGYRARVARAPSIWRPGMSVTMPVTSAFQRLQALPAAAHGPLVAL